MKVKGADLCSVWFSCQVVVKVVGLWVLCKTKAGRLYS